MNKIATFLAVLSVCHLALSQSRVTLSGNSYIVLDNSVNMVLDNPSDNALTSIGSGGILSENENDQLIWHVQTTTGLYTVPFVSPGSLTPIPFSLSINTGGTGSGFLHFATYGGGNWDNNTYRPSDVLHMTDLNTGLSNNSAHVIDRFWIADATGYTTKPSGSLNFTYLDNEITAPGNSMLESDLGAQRFNNSTGQWGDYLPQGTINTVSNTVTNVPVSNSDFFRSWTLSELMNPLPIIISDLDGYCTSNNNVVRWSAETTTPVDYFKIELLNGNEFHNEATIDASPETNYEYFLPLRNQATYRLGVVNHNGAITYTSPYTLLCKNTPTSEIIYNNSDNTWTLQFDAPYNGDEHLMLYDYSGKCIATTRISFTKGTNQIAIPTTNLAVGIYLIAFKNGNEFIRERIILPF